jgi:putative transposase
MTDERMALKALVEKTSDADLLNEMIGFAANRLMALEADALCNAGRHERTADRVNYRNGYRDRMWETRAGSVELETRLSPLAPPRACSRALAQD